MSAKVKNLKIALQSGTDNTLYATWSISSTYSSKVDHYIVIWYYATGDGVSFIGNDGTETHMQSTYSPPSNATKAKVKVKPVSKTYKKNGKETTYFTGTAVVSSVYYFKNSPPAQPSTPNVTMGSSADGNGNYKMTAQIENINDAQTDYMEFRFYRAGTFVEEVIAKKTTERATGYIYVAPGSNYRVKARGINSTSGGTGTKIELVNGNSATLYNPVYGEYSDYSSNATPPPASVTDVAASAYDDGTDSGTSGAVKVTWTQSSGATAYDVEYATDKNYLKKSSNSLNTFSTSVKTNTAYITGLDAGKEWFFTVRATNDTGESGWSDIVSTVIGTTPEAPTTWSASTFVYVGETVNLYWTHNCEDGSDQTAAEIKITDSAGEEQYVSITDDTTSYTLETASWSEGTTVSWCVRTKGIAKDYGEYSIVRTISIVAPAKIGLEMDEIMESFPYTIHVDVEPVSQKVINYYLSIIAVNSYETVDPNGSTVYVTAGEEIYSKLYNESENPIDLILSVGDLTLENDQEYQVVVMASMDTGITTETTDNFTVSWDDNLYDPDAYISIDYDNYVAYIEPYCYTSVDVEEDTDPNDIPDPELVEGITLGVYRRESDGSFVLIGDGIENIGGATISDPHPALDYARYRIVAQDDKTGQISYTDVPGIPVGEPAIIIQWNEEWSTFYNDEPEEMEDPTWSGSLVKLKGNIDVSESHDIDSELIEYVGRRHPVSYYGTQIGETATWNTDVDKSDEETIYSLRRLAAYTGDAYVREPSGTGFWAQISVSMNTQHKETVVPVSLSITRVEGSGY